MSTLTEWNQLSETEALKPVLACCGSRAFAAAVVRARPYRDLDSLLTRSDDIWWTLEESDLARSLACHPRIGESAGTPSYEFAAWSTEEQSKARAGCGIPPRLDRREESTVRGTPRIHLHRLRQRQVGGRVARHPRPPLTQHHRRRNPGSRRTAAANHTYTNKKVAGAISGISTHILDLAQGKPAFNVPDQARTLRVRCLGRS